MLQIPTKSLLLIAAIVWFTAGASVASVGFTASRTAWTWIVVVAFLILFTIFLVMFMRITLKHIKRITCYEEKLSSILKFFDAQSYIIIAIMIGVGAAVRLSGLVPGPAIAALYSGIGLALITSAIYYIVTYVAISDELLIQEVPDKPVS